MLHYEIAEQISPSVNPKVKALGRGLFETKAFREVSLSADKVSCLFVYDGCMFGTSITLKRGRYSEHECTCLSHRYGIICSHVWALALVCSEMSPETHAVANESQVEAGEGTRAASPSNVVFSKFTEVLEVPQVSVKEPRTEVMSTELMVPVENGAAKDHSLTVWAADFVPAPSRLIPEKKTRRWAGSQSYIPCPIFVIDVEMSRACKLLVLRPYQFVFDGKQTLLVPDFIDFDYFEQRYRVSDVRLIEALGIETETVLEDFRLPANLSQMCQGVRRDLDYGVSDVEAFVLGPMNQDAILARLCSLGHLAWCHSTEDPSSVIYRLRTNEYSNGDFEYRVEVDPETDDWIMTPWISATPFGARELSKALVALPGGGVLWDDGWTGALGVEAGPWIVMAKEMGTIRIAPDARESAVRYWGSTPLAPRILWPHVKNDVFVTIAPKAAAIVRPRQNSTDTWDIYGGIRYEEQVIEFPREQYALVYDQEARVVQRDYSDELLQLMQLAEFLGRNTLPWFDKQDDFWSSLSTVSTASDAFESLSGKKLIERCQTLAKQGYEVLLEGARLRTGGDFNVQVESGIDWFDVHGEMDFSADDSNPMSAALPELLAAARKGQQFVKLSDGSIGVLPAEVLERLKKLTDHVQYETSDDPENPGSLRFKRSQAMLLDVLLSSKSMQVVFDAEYTKLLKSLKKIKGVKPAKPTDSFQGELREYQEAGLGWFKFLNDHRFGGCLADEMGLGKTVQVLSMLEGRRKLREKDPTMGPSLAVVPKSLLFNWEAEAQRFTPNMKVLISAGMGRQQAFAKWNEYDLILTTYATLARDVPDLLEHQFDYVVLDEAQAIKNSQTQAAKACRLLSAKHRLALTGTPIENHLGELWSLFEFLNPGMLGRSSQFERLTRSPSPDTLSIISRSISPFVLRRTKSQVLKELPDKVQETIYCELGTKQRKLYNELRDHYRRELTATVKEKGLEKSKIIVLEALLRLRQAACHPGLVSSQHSKLESAKFDELMERLPEIIEGGHKAIIFSQFTSLLGLLQQRLKKAGYRWAYLDGSTRNRRAEVEKFQSDPALPLFLISLKAGGHGLNLTAADYVFLLDPWWNPAVEAQAIDRAHRMGQQRTVFAYRMIAENTIEDKIALLQKSKQELADSVISENESLIRNLTFDDLQLLLE